MGLRARHVAVPTNLNFIDSNVGLRSFEQRDDRSRRIDAAAAEEQRRQAAESRQRWAHEEQVRKSDDQQAIDDLIAQGLRDLRATPELGFQDDQAPALPGGESVPAQGVRTADTDRQIVERIVSDLAAGGFGAAALGQYGNLRDMVDRDEKERQRQRERNEDYGRRSTERAEDRGYRTQAATQQNEWRIQGEGRADTRQREAEDRAAARRREDESRATETQRREKTEKAYDAAIKAIVEGRPQIARNLAARYNLKIPEQMILNADMAKAIQQAREWYFDDEVAGQKFLDAMKQAGWRPEATQQAMELAGIPTAKKAATGQKQRDVDTVRSIETVQKQGIEEALRFFRGVKDQNVVDFSEAEVGGDPVILNQAEFRKVAKKYEDEFIDLVMGMNPNSPMASMRSPRGAPPAAPGATGPAPMPQVPRLTQPFMPDPNAQRDPRTGTPYPSFADDQPLDWRDYPDKTKQFISRIKNRTPSDINNEARMFDAVYGQGAHAHALREHGYLPKGE